MSEGGVSGGQEPRRGATRDQRSPAEIARAGYEAWNSGDLETALEYMHPELLWVSSGVFPGLRSTYSGREGFREFWTAFMEPWETLEVEIEELHELDQQSLLMRVRFHARGRQEIEVDLPITNHLVMRDEKLYRFQAYAEWDDAVADLGIEDPRGSAR
jgi:ketosteroid isomerase-like protein